MNASVYFKSIAGLTLCSLLMFALPLFLLAQDVALGYIAGIPPQLFVTLSWIAGYEYARRNCPDKMFLYTMGMIPMRFAVEIGWFLLLMQVEQVNMAVAVGSAVIHFALFSVPQIMTINTTCSNVTSLPS